MKALIAALSLATLILAAHPANAAPGKLDSDSYLSGQNEKCYWRDNATSSTMKAPGSTIEARSSTTLPG